jgi:hypothetical protein
MTNLTNDTETTGRRLFEPIALALLAAGGLTASVARSDGGGEQPGLVMPPLTAQAHAAGSPAPDATTTLVAFAAKPTPADEPSALAVEPATTKSRQSSAPQGVVNPGRFAEIFAELGAARSSLALVRPEPQVEVAVQPVPSANPGFVTEAAPPVEALKLVSKTAEPALQLVAAQPVPRVHLASANAAPIAELAPSALALTVPEAEQATRLLAIAAPASAAPSAVPATAPIAKPLVADPVAASAEPAKLAVEQTPAAAAPGPVALALAEQTPAAPKLAFVSEPMMQQVPVAAMAKPVVSALVQTAPSAPAPTATPIVADPLPVSAEPAELAVPQIAAAAAPGPVALALAEDKAEPTKLAFVSEPMVQQAPVTAPVTAMAKPIASALAQPAPSVAVAKTRTPRAAPLGGTVASNFQLTDGTIDYRIGARVNGGEPASLALRITRNDQLSVKLGDLLGLVKPQMDPALYAYLAASRGAEEYVSFAAIRASGIDIRYDAARDQLLLGVD